MKRIILGLLILFVLVFPLFVFGQEEEPKEEVVEQQTPWPDSFKKDDFYVYVETKKRDLFPRINQSFMAIRFVERPDYYKAENEEAIQKLILEYGLKEVTGLLVGQEIRVFGIGQVLETEKYKEYWSENDRFLAVLNDLLKEEVVKFVSPIFQYGRSLYIATNEVVIKFRPDISDTSIITDWYKKMGLSNVVYLEKTTIQARVNRDSGRNVFEVANSLHPVFAEEVSVGGLETYWFMGAYPIFTLIRSPIEVVSYSYPLESPDAYTGNTVRSRFKHILVIEYDLSYFKEKDIQINLDELKVGSSFFKAWLPIGLITKQEMKPQFFEIHGQEKVNPASKEKGRFRQEIEYTFSISQTGEWIFPSVRVVYTFINPITNKEETRDTLPDPVIVKIGSILPVDAPTVNDPFKPISISKSESKPSIFSSVAKLCWWIAGVILISLFIGTINWLIDRKRAKDVPSEPGFQEKWQKLGNELLEIKSRREFSRKLRTHFIKSLGLLYFDKESALLTSIISQIEKRLKEKLPEDRVDKIVKFLSDIQKDSHGPEDKEVGQQEIKKQLREAEKLILGE